MKKKILYFVGALLLNILGYIILAPDPSLCFYSFCDVSSFTFNIGKPLFFGMLPISLLFFIFLFIKKERVDNLYRVFSWVAVITVLFIFLVPVSCNALDPICVTKTTFALFISVVFCLYCIVKLVRNK